MDTRTSSKALAGYCVCVYLCLCVRECVCVCGCVWISRLVEVAHFGCQNIFQIASLVFCFGLGCVKKRFYSCVRACAFMHVCLIISRPPSHRQNIKKKNRHNRFVYCLLCLFLLKKKNGSNESTNDFARRCLVRSYPGCLVYIYPDIYVSKFRHTSRLFGRIRKRWVY